MINAILGLIVASLAILGMSIGLILKKKPLQPSCGGVYLSKGEMRSLRQSEGLITFYIY